MSWGWLVALSIAGALVSVCASVGLVVVFLRAIAKSNSWLSAPGNLLSKLTDLTQCLVLLNESLAQFNFGALHERLETMDKKIGKLACSKGNGKDPAEQQETDV